MKEDNMILNLGCGKLKIKNVVNIDCTSENTVADEIVDLGNFPWKWKDNSIDGIYLTHVLEHFPRNMTSQVLKECHRILKIGGFLHIQVPHSSDIRAVGEIEHYRTFCYGAISNGLTHGRTFHFPKDESLFKDIIKERINWIKIPNNTKHPYMEIDRDFPMTNHKILFFISRALSPVINFLINISPVIFERVWCYWIGGAEEILWRGEKIK
ncbi:MAG: methyltransferase domain-containing protein [Candidatus Kaelpia imicola]|nr:methyltransferase domain-containing protein [Candidatus Kaelpia imicola]